MKIYLVTKNPGKLAAANSVFSKYDITLGLVEQDYEEIQAETSLEIAKFTALQAAKDLNAPAIREDHSLYINALKFPGPYTSFFEKKIPASVLLQWLEKTNDRSGYFEIATVYAKPDGFYKEFVYQVPVVVALEEKGNLQEGWAKILMLKGENRTFAEYPEIERISIWNKNYQEIALYLKNNLG